METPAPLARIATGSARNDRASFLAVAHRWLGIVALPFLLLSVLQAVALTHSEWVDDLSARLYPSLPIPPVALTEAPRPGSWDQALALANLSAAGEARVIVQRDARHLRFQGFQAHAHDGASPGERPRLAVDVDIAQMAITRISDQSSSLVAQAHALHALHFFGVPGLGIGSVSVAALIGLVISGALLARRQRQLGTPCEGVSRWHVRAGLLGLPFILAIALTTLHLEFGIFGPAEPSNTHPLPPPPPAATVIPGSLDQARQLVRDATGALPRAAYIRKGGAEVKFSEAGDGIGGQSVWMDLHTMTIRRITDWRNDRQALLFIVHDGRWLGGMNAVNVHDVVALGLLFLAGSGLVIARRRRADASATRLHRGKP